MKTYLTHIQKLFNKTPIFISLAADLSAIGITLYTFLTIRSLIPSAVMVICLLLYFWILLRSSKPNISALTWRTKLSQTDITLFIYAILGSIIIVTIRTANGFMDAPSMGGLSNEHISAIHLNAGWSIYDKSHIRLAFLEFWFYFGCILITSLLTIRYWGRYWSHILKLHPATALFAVLLFFGTVRLPPYHIQWVHWTSFLGPGLDVINGNWPLLHIQNGYGFLFAGVFAIWIKLFAISSLSLAAIIILIGIITHILTYLLIKELSRSPWISLLLSSIAIFGFLSFRDEITIGVNSPVRWHLVLILSLYMIWITLSRKKIYSIVWSSMLLGVTFLWNPLMMLFPITAFAGVQLYRFMITKNGQTLLSIVSALIGTIAPIGLIFLFSNGMPNDGIAGILNRVSNIALLFGGGFGNFPQYSIWLDILSFTIIMTTIYLIYRRTQKQRLVLRRDDLFLLCCVATIIFPLGYAMGRNVDIGLRVVSWVLIIPTSLLVSKFWRLTQFQRLPTWPFAVAVALLLLYSNSDLPNPPIDKFPQETGIYPLKYQNIFTNIFQSVNQFLTGYENERWAWSVECAGLIQKGITCDFNKRPSLRKAIEDDSRMPLTTLGDNQTNSILITACQNGWAIISSIDTYVYLQGNCQTQLPSSALLDTTYADIASPGWIPAILQHNIVLVDQRTDWHGAYGRFIELLGQRLEAEGYESQPLSTTHVVAFIRTPLGVSISKELNRLSLQ